MEARKLEVGEEVELRKSINKYEILKYKLYREYNYEEEKKIDPLVRQKPKVQEKAKKRISVDLSALDPSTFKEKFKGFNRDDYEGVLKANNVFFKVGYAKYLEAVEKGKNFH